MNHIPVFKGEMDVARLMMELRALFPSMVNKGIEKRMRDVFSITLESAKEVFKNILAENDTDEKLLHVMKMDHPNISIIDAIKERTLMKSICDADTSEAGYKAVQELNAFHAELASRYTKKSER